MLAAYITSTGPATNLVIGEMARPNVGPHDVLVRVTCAAINPIDTYIRSGAMAQMIGSFPYIPGCDLAGEVTAVGSDCSQFQIGDRVWGSNQGLFGRQGTLAQLASVNEGWLYPIPAGVSDENACAAALVGITAQLGLFNHADIKSGDYLFINGGSGGVGLTAIQLAKHARAIVVATAGSEAKRQLCQQAGADLVLDYRAEDIDQTLASFAQTNGGYSIWLDTQRDINFDRMVSLLRPCGRIVLMAGRGARPEFPVGPFYAKDLQMRGFAMFNASQVEQQAAAVELNKALASGALKPHIGARFPLAEAANAHQHQEDNTLHKKGSLCGKIVVTMPT